MLLDTLMCVRGDVWHLFSTSCCSILNYGGN